MTDKELIVAKRVCQYTKAVQPPTKWSDGYTTNPRLSSLCSAVRTVIYLKLGLFKNKDARKIPLAEFMKCLDSILPEREDEE